MARSLKFLVAVLALVLACAPAKLPAQTLAQAAKPAAPAKPEMAESCPGLIASRSPFTAAMERVALNADQVRIS
jgi:hypothetical protein